MKTFRKIFFIVWMIGMIFFAIMSAIGYMTGEWRFHYDVYMEDASICRGSDPDTGKPINPTESIVLGSDEIFVCGYLHTGTDIAVDLAILIYKEGIDGAIARNSIDDRYFAGSFFFEIPNSYFQGPGNYRVDVYFARDRIVSEEFKVIAP